MKVSLFATCLVDQFFPNVGASVVRLLRRFGCEVEFPEKQICCGQPAFNAGYVDAARRVALHTINVFSDAEYVVMPSGSCCGMIHHYYPELFSHDKTLHGKAIRFAEKSYEFSQFMVDILGIDDIGGRFPHRVTYHPSCHGTRLLGIQDQPLRLLQSVRDMDLIPLPEAEDCCGFGGIFSVKLGTVSGAMVKEKVGNIVSTGATYVAGIDMGCLMNIGGYMKKQGISIEPIHLAQLLERGIHSGEEVS